MVKLPEVSESLGNSHQRGNRNIEDSSVNLISTAIRRSSSKFNYRFQSCRGRIFSRAYGIYVVTRHDLQFVFGQWVKATDLFQAF
ncbi:hypothetical protein ACH3XW_48430 [Acanthocheilonema viteae]